MKSYTHFTLTERECLSEKIKEGKEYGLKYTENEAGGLTAHLLLGECS